MQLIVVSGSRPVRHVRWVPVGTAAVAALAVLAGIWLVDPTLASGA